MKFSKALTKKTVLAISTASIIAIIFVATYMPAFAITTDDSQNSSRRWGSWAATVAIRKARQAINHAMDVIVEQATGGENVTLAKNMLKASIRIYGFSERAFGQEHYRASFFTGILSALVAHDSARIAEGEANATVIVDEIGDRIKEIETFLDELEASGVDVSLPHKMLRWANATHTRAERLLGEGKPIRAVVIAEVSRIIAQLAKKVALAR